jgi:hypothetical protein
MNYLFIVGGLTKVKVPSRLLCFGKNGVDNFQGAQGGIIIKIQNLHVRLLMGIHCMAHMTNLAIHTLFGLSMVAHPKEICSSPFTQFLSFQNAT